MESYTTIKNTHTAEIVVKKSRFIAQCAHAATEAEALEFLENVRASHRTARHNVFAYVLRENNRVRYSDDGEPAKTAGIPVLEAIQHAGLCDVIVVVTRYFGGTLLGTGGLVRAYTQSAQAGLAAAQKLTFCECVTFDVQIPYSLYDQVMHVAPALGATVIDSQFADVVNVQLRVKSDEAPALEKKLTEIMRTTGTLRQSAPEFAAI